MEKFEFYTCPPFSHKVMDRESYLLLRKRLRPADMFIVDCYYVEGYTLKETSSKARMTERRTFGVLEKALEILEKNIRKRV